MENLTGHVALQAADDLLFRLALRGTPFHVASAGVPWLAVALGPRPLGEGGRRSSGALSPARGWEQALAALVGAVEARGAVACVSAPAPPPAALGHASSLTVACARQGWHMAHGDVAGLRVRLTVVKSKIGVQGAEAALLLRYPRPYSDAEVVGLPAVMEEPLAQQPGPLPPVTAPGGGRRAEDPPHGLVSLRPAISALPAAG